MTLMTRSWSLSLFSISRKVWSCDRGPAFGVVMRFRIRSGHLGEKVDANPLEEDGDAYHRHDCGDNDGQRWRIDQRRTKIGLLDGAVDAPE